MPKNKHTSGNGEYVLLTGSSNTALSESIAKHLNKTLHNPISVFSDGEIRVKVPENCRRRHVFIIQSTCPPVNTSIMELIFMVDAAQRSSASEITAVIPYYGYSRQDRKEMPRVPISSSVIANILENAGVNRIVTLDIHSEQQQGFIKSPWDNLYGSYALIPEIKKRKLKNLVVAAPDKGGMTRATGYAKLLGIDDIALVYKERDVKVNNVSDASAMIGDVKGRDVLLVDDMIDTGGTVAHAARFLKKEGAQRVIICATHGIFSGNAPEKFTDDAVDELIITDSVPLRDEMKKNKKVSVVSVAPLISEAIKRIESGESISRDLIL